MSLCTSLEQVPADRERLSKKLNKRYKNADPEYTSSQHFKNFVKSCIEKIKENNLYLIAKELCDNLSAQRVKVDFKQYF